MVNVDSTRSSGSELASPSTRPERMTDLAQIPLPLEIDWNVGCLLSITVTRAKGG